MADGTKIEWADATFNPWVGCTKVSAACDHCYAEAWAKRTGQAGLWSGERRRTSDANWRLPLKWNAAAKAAGARRRVFCASIADVFDNQIPDAWRQSLWGLIADCRHLDWMLLTKRPQNIAKMLPSTTCEVMVMGKAWPWPHVWLGTTTENQEEADRRIPHLLSVPAAVHFISAEPLLGPIDLGDWICHPAMHWNDRPGLNLIICGGESGHSARPMHPEWARSLRDQCRAAGAAFHFKQWGQYFPSSEAEYVNDDGSHRHMLVAPDGRYGDTVADWLTKPAGTVWMRRVGKAAAGRLLDGRTWDEFPA